MAEEAKVKKRPGRPRPPDSDKRKQFLAVMLEDTIKSLKQAAIEEDTTASLLLERIANEYLQSRKGRGRKS
ncbi:hypothetical protein [Bradyrhizobium sp. ORS 86]|uniref:hypothetical protein n=1 Tax=Bradyrhizobium sp. ORS 86 TaxID=1685970 RepID=UPI00388D4843